MDSTWTVQHETYALLCLMTHAQKHLTKFGMCTQGEVIARNMCSSSVGTEDEFRAGLRRARIDNAKFHNGDILDDAEIDVLVAEVRAVAEMDYPF